MRRTARWCAAAVTLAWMSLAACQRSEPTDAPVKAAPSNTAAPSTASPASQNQPSASDTVATAATNPAADSTAAQSIVPTIDFALPQTVAVGKGDLVLTIAEAAIEPRNSESMRLVFLVRMLNKQGLAAEFADPNFRLVVQDSVIKANGGLAETVGAGTESRLERVQFLVPMSSVPRALQLEFGGETIELPVALKR